VKSTFKAPSNHREAVNLADEAIQVRVSRRFDVQGAVAHIAQSVFVDHQSALRVMDQQVRRTDPVRRLGGGSGHLQSRIECELELRFVFIVGGQAFEQERAEAGARASATTE
jgi:hypothetical protein